MLPPKHRTYTKPDGSTSKRPIKEQAYMIHAIEMAKNATCDRLQVGAVFTDPDMTRVLCAGYNGSYAGGPNGCISKEPGNCGDVHAEVNSLTKSREDLRNSICFVTTAPCRACSTVLINRGIKKVIYLQDYRLNEGLAILRESGVEVIKYEDLPG
jgi:dCMP deaminase